MFQKARLKLTFWYVLFIMMISSIFSLSIYAMQLRDLNRFENEQRTRFERQLERGQLYFDQYPYSQQIFTNNIDLINEARQRLAIGIFRLNGIILILSGVLAYVLSGKTLKPIADMVVSQNRFISDASHELKTPLTSLKTAFEVHLRDKKRTLKESDLIIEESIMEVDKLQFLAQSLLEITIHQKPVDKNNFFVVSIKKVLSQSIKQIKPLADKKSIKIIQDISDASVLGNSGSLLNLFVILLDNAIKYSQENSEIKVVSSSKGKGVIISVSDNGFGISKTDLPHVFERFYRADCARCKDDGAGYGLGLSIAKQIVTTHQGTITVDSEIDKGSTFTVNLQTFNLKQIFR